MVLFLSGIGADNCGFGNPFSAPPPPPPSTTKPFCETDPRSGCRVTCTDVNIATLSDQCAAALPGGPGPLATNFIEKVQAAEASLTAQGTTFCTAADAATGRFLTPCSFGIAPTVVAPSDACMPPPPGWRVISRYLDGGTRIQRYDDDGGTRIQSNEVPAAFLPFLRDGGPPEVTP
jgi:hypothetical protein